MAMIGRNAAIAEVGKHRHQVEGPLAFAAWLGVHAMLLTERDPQQGRRVSDVGLGQAWLGLLRPRPRRHRRSVDGLARFHPSWVRHPASGMMRLGVRGWSAAAPPRGIRKLYAEGR